MKNLLAIILLLASCCTWAQDNLTEAAQPIVEEGKKLYKSEMASWYGTDLFLEKFEDRDKIGGYVSYATDDGAQCVFLSKTNPVKVIGTITFDSTYNPREADLDLTERDMTKNESDLFAIRKVVSAEMQSNEDDFFKFYQNTSLNIIPLIDGKMKKAYVLTGPKVSGVVIFGNDYLLTFDDDNRIVTKKALHNNLIPVEYEKNATGEEAQRTMHNHLPETGKYITATDICTLMLYSKFAGWKEHDVVSEKILNVWNCEENRLLVLSMDMVEKINKSEEAREKERAK